MELDSVTGDTTNVRSHRKAGSYSDNRFAQRVKPPTAYKSPLGAFPSTIATNNYTGPHFISSL